MRGGGEMEDMRTMALMEKEITDTMQMSVMPWNYVSIIDK